MDRGWYYTALGEKHGPVSDIELKALADGKQMLPDDLVWTEGLSDWKPAKRVMGLFAQEPTEPPPLPTKPGSDASTRLQDLRGGVQGRLKAGWAGVDRWAWALVAVPIVGAVIELLVGRVFILLFIVLNCVFGFADEKRLKAAGLSAPSGWWTALLVPVYLWKRGTALRQPRVLFGVWVASFLVSLVLSLSLEDRGLEDTARPLVTQILHEQLGARAAKCVRVRITEDIGGGYYKAVATLDNGNDLRILIESRRSMVYVTVPP